MSLYERLKPEAVEKLIQVRKQYPTTAENIEKSLKSTDFVIDLLFKDVMRISDFIIDEPLGVLKVYDIFEDRK